MTDRVLMLSEKELKARLSLITRRTFLGWGLNLKAVAEVCHMGEGRLQYIVMLKDCHLRPTEHRRLNDFFKKYDAGKIGVYRTKDRKTYMVHLRQPQERKVEPLKIVKVGELNLSMVRR